MRYFIGFMLLINLLYGNLHRYDDSEYIDEINEEEYQGAYDDSDDEYRPNSYYHQPPRPLNNRVIRPNQEKRGYALHHDAVRFSDEDRIREINKEEFEEIEQSRSISENLSIPYGVPIKVEVDIASQRMNIYAGGKRYHQWKISTGTWKYPTPTGYYSPYYLKKMHYSKKYDDAPMPHSIFFRGGYAIHGTESISRLGQRASHGCIRLHPDNAKKLFHLMQERGKHKFSIVVH